MAELVIEDGCQRCHRHRLSALLKKTQGTVRIASAYVTDRALLLGTKNRSIRLLVSLMPMDIASGATSLETLRVLIEFGVECRFLSYRPRLHAKVYIFGNATAVVTSANLTANAFDSNIEVGVEVSGRDVEILTNWFDKFWSEARPLTVSHLADLNQQNLELRREYSNLKKKTRRMLEIPSTPSPSEVFSDDLRDLMQNARRFFVCNTDRRQGERTATGGYALEQEMRNRGYATAWESFKFPNHMKQVQPGDAVLMYAKGVGIIGIGRAKARCETLEPENPDRIRNFEDEENTTEWRIPVRWLDWCDDEDAYHWRAPNFTFWNITDLQYTDFRNNVRRYFVGDD